MAQQVLEASVAVLPPSATSCNNPRCPVRGAEALTSRKQDGGAEKALTLTCPCLSRAIRGEDALVLKRAEHFPTRQGLPGPRPRGSRLLQATCVDWLQPPFSGASGGPRPWGGSGLGPPSPWAQHPTGRGHVSGAHVEIPPLPLDCEECRPTRPRGSSPGLRRHSQLCC